MSRSKDVPPFGPPIPKSVTFPKSAVFRDFLLAKVINGENAAHKSEKFRAMATRTRQEYLKDLAENFVSTATMDSAVKFSFISLGGKKKEKVKPRKDAHLLSVGAITWSVRARDFGQSMDFDCLLGISNEFIVLIEEESKNVIFNCSCRDVIGWTSGIMSIKIFYERGECVMLSAHDNCGEDIREMVQRLEVSRRQPDLTADGQCDDPLAARRRLLPSASVSNQTAHQFQRTKAISSIHFKHHTPLRGSNSVCVCLVGG